MSRLRRYVVEEAREAVLRAAKFRLPQRDSFDNVCRLFERLEDDLAAMSDDQLARNLKNEGIETSSLPPQLLFALATGLGKTRLMGAIIAFLFRARQSRNVLILAPRAAILEKLERESQLRHPKYLLLDESLLPEPNLCFRSNIESFRPSPDQLNLFILSPQSITGRERRFGRASEFRGFSILDYLSGLRDLVVFVDEAHHVSAAVGDDAAAWMTGIRALRPRLYFGLTATPRNEPGVTTLHTYDLAQSLRDGVFTKAVDLIVEPRDEQISDVDWDHFTIDFALRRLEKKKAAIAECRLALPSFPAVEPVLLIAARDTAHADEIGAWLRSARGLSDDELFITHSEKKRTEEEIGRLVAIDRPENKIRVVVNVFQLSEGWDVTNVYVVAPLRAMATFTNAVQTMGRGLRLPMERRSGHVEADTLDVLCCGRQSFEDIVEEAIKAFGGPDGDLGISVSKLDLTDITVGMKEVEIAVREQVEFEVPSVERMPGEPVLDFDVVNASSLMRGGATALHLGSMQRTGLDDGVTYPRIDFTESVAARILAQLPYLSQPLHGPDVSRLIGRVLDAFGAGADDPIAVDPMRVAAFLADEIDHRFKQQTSSFRVVGAATMIRPKAFTARVPTEWDGPVAQVRPKEWR